MDAIEKDPSALSFLEVHLDRFDCNEALKRAGYSMALNNRLLEGEQEVQVAKKSRAEVDPGDDEAFYSVIAPAVEN